ncbi:MAG TPA: MFS transporter [Thermomicrobiales bacterium]|nr:MFS transporter [Thermomicrobiales bacterium]
MERAARWQIGLGRENGIAFWAVTLMEASFSTYVLLWPLYIAQLGADPARVGVIIGVQGLLRLVFLAPSGYLVDRLPPVRLIMLARGLHVVGLLLAVAMPVWWLLFVPLVFVCAATAGFPAISALIAGAASGRDQARAFTLIYTVGPAVAAIVAPALGGKVAELVSLRAALLVGAALSAASIVVYSRLAGRPRPAHQANPPSYREALAYRPLRRVCLLELATLLVLTTGITLVPNYLHDVHGLTFDWIGQLGSVAAVGSILLSVAVTRLPPLRQPLFGVTVATGAATLFFGGLLVAGSLPAFAPVFLLRGGYMVAWSLYSAALGRVAPPRLHGRAFALGEIFSGVGWAAAPFLAGPLYEWHPAAPLVVALAAGAPLVAALWLFARRERAGALDPGRDGAATAADAPAERAA